MKTFTRFLLSALLAGSLSGCATSSGTKMEDAKISTIKKGVTTRAEVEKLFGKPASVTTNADGKKTLLYRYTETKEGAGLTAMRAASFIPSLGFGTTAAAVAAGQASSVKVGAQSLSIRLSNDDIVEDFTFSESASESGSPKLLPGKGAAPGADNK